MQTGYEDTWNVQSYDITWSNNCCEETTIGIAPRYDLDLDTLDCTSFTVLTITFTQYEINLFGINGNFISTITAQPMNLPNSTPSNLTFVVQPDNSTNVMLVALASVPSTNYDIVITTNAGYSYTMHLLLNQNPGTPCVDYSILGDGGPLVTYPELPENVDFIDANTLDFNALVGEEILPSGVYQVVICENGDTNFESTCVQNHMFLDCGDLKCFVIRKFAECVDTDVMNYYEALTFLNDCTDNVTYDEACAIYEVLNIKLATDGCYAQEDDCNCAGVRTKANKTLTPIRKSSTTKKGCGCG
jgi:hypothetical protein